MFEGERLELMVCDFNLWYGTSLSGTWSPSDVVTRYSHSMACPILASEKERTELDT